MTQRELKRRSAIQPMIGHMKEDGHLGRNHLLISVGDAMNALLVAAGHNLRLILNWLRFLWPGASRLS
jgi:IS5 family transposase